MDAGWGKCFYGSAVFGPKRAFVGGCFRPEADCQQPIPNAHWPVQTFLDHNKTAKKPMLDYEAFKSRIITKRKCT
jgi:hypothetical protein